MNRVLVVFFIILLGSFSFYPGRAWANDYSRLIEFILLEDQRGPLHPFSDFDETFDDDSHHHISDYFKNNPSLLRKIGKDLGDGNFRWRIDRFESRYAFIPEQRQEYAALFESYCKDVIGYILDQTNLPDPYQQIQTLKDERPEIPEQGITAFIVHNLVEEFLADCTFSGQKRKRVKIKLKGTVFVGEVGSYISEIHLKKDGRFEFSRNEYTIWQNSAENPYTALMVPAEETLHILLRRFTERAINDQIKTKNIDSIHGLEQIALELTALEEAIVGGLVYNLLPQFLTENIQSFDASWIEQDRKEKLNFQQYRYLNRGIEVVKTQGFKTAINLYMQDPLAFKELLLAPEIF